MVSGQTSRVSLLGCTLLVGTLAAQPVYSPDRGPWPKGTPESQGMSPELLKQAPSKMTVKNGDLVVSSIPVGTGILIRNGYDVWHYGDPYMPPESRGPRVPGLSSCLCSVLRSKGG